MAIKKTFPAQTLLWNIHGTWFDVDFKKVNPTQVTIIDCRSTDRIPESTERVGIIHDGNKLTIKSIPKDLTFKQKEEYLVINLEPTVLKESEYYANQALINSGLKLYQE